jgi:hypothetical protein
MKHLKLTAGVAVLALAGTALHAADKDAAAELKAPQASIPFASQGASIRDWQANGRDGLWVQDAHKQWYYAELVTPCLGLDFAVRVGFETRGTDTLDRFGSVVVPGHERCAIKSFTKSEAPPKD